MTKVKIHLERHTCDRCGVEQTLGEGCDYELRQEWSTIQAQTMTGSAILSEARYKLDLCGVCTKALSNWSSVPRA